MTCAARPPRSRRSGRRSRAEYQRRRSHGRRGFRRRPSVADGASLTLHPQLSSGRGVSRDGGLEQSFGSRTSDRTDGDDPADAHSPLPGRGRGRCKRHRWQVPAARRTRTQAAPTRRAARRSEPKKPRSAPWWELPVLIAVAIAVAVLIKTFLVQPFYIPSESMEKTLHGCPGCSGDRVLVNKLIFDLRDPHPGDIVVFRAPPNWDEEPTPSSPSNPDRQGCALVRATGRLRPAQREGPDQARHRGRRAVGASAATRRAASRSAITERAVRGTRSTSPTSSRTARGTHAARPGRSPPEAPTSARSARSTYPRAACGSWVITAVTPRTRGTTASKRLRQTTPAVPQQRRSRSSKVIGKGVLIAWPPSRWRTLGTPSTFKQTADAALPALGGAALVLPVFAIRRRRRRL